MNLLPFRVVPLASALSPGALSELLRGVVGAGPPAPFSGTVAADGFVITRMNELRGTALPLLRGTLVAQTGGGTGVLLRLRQHRIVSVFMGIWLGFLAAVAAVIVAAHARDAGRSLLWLLAPAGIGAFSWYLMAEVFAAEARWAAEHLVESIPALRFDGIGADQQGAEPRGTGRPLEKVRR